MSTARETDVHAEVLIAIEDGELDRARVALAGALELQPSSADAHAALGAFLLDRGELRIAAGVLDRGRALDASHLRLGLLRSVALERLGLLDDAKEQAAACAAIAPVSPAVQRQIGRIAAKRGDRRAAIDAFKNLVELTGAREREAMAAFGAALSEDGRHDEAIRVLRSAAQLEPRAPEAHADLGMAFYAAGRIDEASKAFAHAAELGNGCAQAHLGLGLAHAKLERWKDAIHELRIAARLAPSSDVGHFNLGLALAAAGDVTNARASMLRAAALSPNDPEIAGALDRLLDVPDARSITGDLDTFPLESLLEFLRVQTKSGALTVLAPQGAGVIRLAEGRFVSALAPKSKRLGEMMLERKLLRREQFERALFEQRSMAGEGDAASSLGAIVLRHGWVEEETLVEVVREQILGALSEIMDWKEGTFSFHAEPAETAPALTFDVQYMTLELFRLRDEHRALMERQVSRER